MPSSSLRSASRVARAAFTSEAGVTPGRAAEGIIPALGGRAWKEPVLRGPALAGSAAKEPVIFAPVVAGRAGCLLGQPEATMAKACS